MDAAQEIALFYVIPIALWLVLLTILFRVWWSQRLEDSLAYLVYLRERKVRFVSLIAALAGAHLVGMTTRMIDQFGWLSDTMTLTIGVMAAVVGGVVVFLFAYYLLWRGPSPLPVDTVIDVPEHLAYSLGVVDRAESRRGPP